MAYANPADQRAYNASPARQAVQDRYNHKRYANPLGRLKQKARVSVAYAVRTGRLNKPTVCSCGGTVEGCNGGPLQAHHDDYSKPLDVRWLSSFCHRLADAALKASKRAEAELELAA